MASQGNLGTGGAYNTGVALARGEWMGMCSADDMLLPQHLAAMSGAIARERDYDIYSSNGYTGDLQTAPVNPCTEANGEAQSHAVMDA